MNAWIEVNKIRPGRYEVYARLGSNEFTFPVRSIGRSAYAVDLPKSGTLAANSIRSIVKMVDHEVGLLV